MILRRGIAFVLLKSILCIINIVDCIVRGYILYIYIYTVRARQLQEIKRRGVTIVRYPSRDRRRKTEGGEKEKKIEVTEQYDDIFSQLDQCQIFSIESLKLLDSLDRFHVEAYA